MAVNHPSTCQCGGSGKLPKECTCNCNPCGCTFYECHRSYAEIPEWENEFDLRFVNSIAGKKGYRYIRQYSTIPRDIKDFIKRLLSSHSQQLQERHEAGLLKLVNDLREDYKCPDKDCAPCYSRESVLSAVESYATHLNPKS